MSEELIQPTEAGQAAVEPALQAIKDRSFSGRNPHLGRMINCAFCNLRHRQNERQCQQKFATDENGVVYGELKPPEGLTELTKKQVFGSQMFHKRRARPRTRPKKKLNEWVKRIVESKKQKENNGPDSVSQ